MDHILFLTIALTALLLGSLPKLKFVSTLALGILIADFLINFKEVNASAILHFSIDLIIVSVLATLAQYLNKNWIKALYIPIAIFLLHTIHPVNTINNSTPTADKVNAFEELEILAQIKPEVNIEKWIKSNAKYFDITYPLFTPNDKSGLLDEYVGINIKEDQDISAIQERLNTDLSVAYSELNEVLELKLPPVKKSTHQDKTQNVNDPLSKNQWSINKSELDDLHKLITTHTLTNNTDSETIIAILDTGIEANHEDLKDNYFSFNASYDRDVRGHGTHCAGIAAAVTGNNIGIASLLPAQTNIKVSSIKVLSNFGIGAQHQIIAGIIEAADKGASVISMSLGAPSSPDKESAYEQAVSYARQQGAIVIVSAGNSNDDAARYSPANTNGVITVASIDKNNKKSSFSNTINNVAMGIYAPGQEIYSTMKGNTYTYMSGTSMASPFVAGLVGLLKSIDPNITTEEVYDILITTSTDSKNLSVINPVEAIKKMLAR